jgi:hypothetical protein
MMQRIVEQRKECRSEGVVLNQMALSHVVTGNDRSYIVVTDPNLLPSSISGSSVFSQALDLASRYHGPTIERLSSALNRTSLDNTAEHRADVA